MSRETVPARLFKYGRAERIQNVLDGQIRFTQAAALNDPFELQPIFDLVRTSKDLLDDVMPSAPQLLLDAVANHYSKMGALERAMLPPLAELQSMAIKAAESEGAFATARAVMEPSARDVLARVQEQLTRVLQNELGILSLTDAPLSTLMWSLYGDEHRGVAFEFNTSHLWFDRRRSNADECFHLRRVCYLDLAQPERTFLQIADENPLIAKALPWAYEREWRMLAPISSAVWTHAVADMRGAIHLFELDVSAVTGIILGMRASEGIIRDIASRIRSNASLGHIHLRQVTQKAGTASLKMVDLPAQA